MSELVIRMNSLENVLKEHVSALSEYIGTSSTRTSATSMTRPGHPLSSSTFGRSYAQTLAGASAPEDHAQCSSAYLPSAQSGSVPRTQYDQHTQDGQSQPHEYRMMVREELLELDERKKRRSSLVIRGLRASTTAEATARFAEVTETLIGEKVVLSETCCIKKSSDLYRGNVHCTRQRQLILDHAKDLKDSTLSHVYIKRDLTYKQRMELQARFYQHQSNQRNIRPTSAWGSAS